METRYYKKDGHVYMVKNKETIDVTEQYNNAHEITRTTHPDLVKGTIPYQDKFYKNFYSEVE